MRGISPASAGLNHPPHSISNRGVFDKITEVAKQVFYTLLGSAFFVTNPVIFSISFFAGVIFDEKAQDVLDRVAKIWETQPWTTLGVIGLGAILSLQVSWATAGVIFASKFGCHLWKSSNS